MKRFLKIKNFVEDPKKDGGFIEAEEIIESDSFVSASYIKDISLEKFNFDEDFEDFILNHPSDDLIIIKLTYGIFISTNPLYHFVDGWK